MPLDDTNPTVQILYAEDDPPSGRLVRSIAETEGYSVKVVMTGQEFLRALSEDKPDLLLLDLNLPDGSGLDFLAKARIRSPEAPVIRTDVLNKPLSMTTSMKRRVPV